jgi:hypothetical protein
MPAPLHLAIFKCDCMIGYIIFPLILLVQNTFRISSTLKLSSMIMIFSRPYAGSPQNLVNQERRVTLAPRPTDGDFGTADPAV